MVIKFNLSQLLKVFFSIQFKPSGSDTDVKEVQPAKAHSPMCFMFSGIVRDVRNVQLANARELILVISLGIISSVINSLFMYTFLVVGQTGLATAKLILHH